MSNTPAAQAQLNRWYLESREHNVAHAQVSTRADRLQRWSGVTAAVLAVFSGGAWTADLANVGLFSSTTVQWVAAMAAFLTAIIVAISTASSWKQESAEHTADKLLWATVDSDIEEIRLHSNGSLDDQAMAKLVKDRADALNKEHNLTPQALDRAKQWLAANRAGS